MSVFLQRRQPISFLVTTTTKSIYNQRPTTTTSSSATTRRWISSSSLIIEPTKDKSRFAQMPQKEDLKFGKTFSDHMLMVEWNIDTKWGPPRIVPYQDLKLSPAASVLHYGLECFEGMKAYKSLTDPSTLRLFRPELNMERLKNSMTRLHMSCEDVDSNELLTCIQKLVRLDQDWIPHGDGYSLYLRPTVISTNPYLGVAAPTQMLLYVITCPVGPYYTAGGFAPVKLTADSIDVRAWPGGTGGNKLGGNYGPTIRASADALERGYDQVLWLFGEDEEITEVGSMNIFFLLESSDGSGRQELVTPPLERGDVLPGVTRRSILELTQQWGEFDVVERFPTMPEIRDAAKSGRLIEAFGTGTAAIVSPIECIQYQGEDIQIRAVGNVTQRIWNELTAIQYGNMKGPEGWSVVID